VIFSSNPQHATHPHRILAKRALVTLLTAAQATVCRAQIPFTTPATYINVITQGAKCDGTTDDAPAFNAALAQADPAKGGVGAVFVPPSATACRLGTPIILRANETLFTNPANAATLAPIAPFPRPTATPLLVVVNTIYNVTISGLAFDGDGQNVGASGTLITVYNAAHVLFNQISITNARGLGLIFAGNTTNSGIQSSYFANNGVYYLTHGGVNDLADRAQTIVFCCATPAPGGTWAAQGNFAVNNSFGVNGFDNLTIGQQTSFTAQNNSFAGTSNGANIYCADTSNTLIEGNHATGASGNGIDCFINSYLTIKNNLSWGNGAAGIQAAGTNHGWITGNTTMNNFLSVAPSWAVTHPGSYTSLHRGGITLGGQPTSGGNVSNTTSYMIIEDNISGNAATYGAAGNDQPYGIQIGTSACTLKTGNLTIANNTLSGNTISPQFTYTGTNCGP